MTREFDLLARLAARIPDPPDVVLGIGDDAAVVTVGDHDLAFAVDAVVDAVHFDREISGAGDVGWKAIAQNVSDLAAIGTSTSAAVVALHLPTDLDVTWLDGLYDGMREACERWGLGLVGGDIVRSATLSISASVIGPAPSRALRRDAARPGDLVAIVGGLGLAASGLALWRAGHHDLLEAHPQLLAAHRRPLALPEAGIALAEVGARAAIDVSDGLGGDAGHVAAASGVAIVIEEDALPRDPGVVAARQELGDPTLAVGGGDDLALLVTLPADLADAATEAMRRVGHDITVIGRVEEGSGVTLVRSDGSTLDISRYGYDHGTSE